MPTTFRPYHPEQSYLLPPSPKDWLPEGHLAYFISDTVDMLDLSGFYRPYAGDGRRNRPFEPRMMIKILLYGYAVGARSSRKIAKKIQEDVAFRVLAAGNFPAHRTIAEFRQRHLEEFQGLFLQVMQIANEAGMLKLGTVAVDGAKVKANASKRKAMSYKRMKEAQEQLRKEIAAIVQEAVEIDDEEDRRYGADNQGDELPEELRRREQRLAKIRAAKERLESGQAEEDRAKGRHENDDRKSPRGGRKFKREFGVPKDCSQENFTDPDSRIMKTSTEGFQQSYNTQIAVDESAQLIVATGLTQNAADSGQLIPMVERIESNAGKRPSRVLADSGYRNEKNFQVLEVKKVDAYVPLGREGKSTTETQAPNKQATERMHKKLETPIGRARYRRRKAIVEPVYGWIKEILGFRRFTLRGIGKVAAEWDLVCTSVNLKRLHSTVCWI